MLCTNIVAIFSFFLVFIIHNCFIDFYFLTLSFIPNKTKNFAFFLLSYFLRRFDILLLLIRKSKTGMSLQTSNEDTDDSWILVSRDEGKYHKADVDVQPASSTIDQGNQNVLDQTRSYSPSFPLSPSLDEQSYWRSLNQLCFYGVTIPLSFITYDTNEMDTLKYDLMIYPFNNWTNLVEIPFPSNNISSSSPYIVGKPCISGPRRKLIYVDYKICLHCVPHDQNCRFHTPDHNLNLDICKKCVNHKCTTVISGTKVIVSPEIAINCNLCEHHVQSSKKNAPCNFLMSPRPIVRRSKKQKPIFAKEIKT